MEKTKSGEGKGKKREKSMQGEGRKWSDRETCHHKQKGEIPFTYPSVVEEEVTEVDVVDVEEKGRKKRSRISQRR
jgi:hypothetical protein